MYTFAKDDGVRSGILCIAIICLELILPVDNIHTWTRCIRFCGLSITWRSHEMRLFYSLLYKCC